MTDQTRIEESKRESPWGKFKAQFYSWVSALDNDPLEHVHERERSLSSLSSEVECVKFRIKALALQMSPPT
ncbi:MAG: hypothetical protein JKY86_02220 [Gammaproteobacteria bacterium]|nr:hypothetical protein [Gammaproteobacteria bacterium]